MWKYQRQFCNSLNEAARALCRALDAELHPEVFLVGCRRGEEHAGEPSVWVEPQDGALHASRLLAYPRQAEFSWSTHAAPAERGARSSTLKSQESRLASSCLQDALLSMVREHSSEAEEAAQWFCSAVAPVGASEVAVLIKLTHTADSPPYVLPKVHAASSFDTSPPCLADAVVEEFLADCAASLDVLEPRKAVRFHGRKPEEILRAAGHRMMNTPVWAARNLVGLDTLFDACNIISSLRYEGEEGLGSMLIARPGHPSIQKTVLLHKPLALSEHQGVRKLVEISSNEQSLLCDGASVYGLGQRQEDYREEEADLFEVRFTRFFTWELLHAEQRMMRVAYGQPHLPQPRIAQAKLRRDLEATFPGLSPAQADRLISLVRAASRQSHGALLVISARAEDEAQRLATQCTRVTPVRLTPELLLRLTAIDGAVLLNPRGICFAIGAILDGLATPHGDPSRGARYNSSVRYVAGQPQCLAVVVSEDGLVEWLTARDVEDRMPRR